ncbi:MAG: 2-succinyl-6-hydroxy-2,4-cyclohexadiene-1-carboxylate synthase [Cyanobacteria bacterium J06555_13]
MPTFSTEYHSLHYVTKGNSNKPPLLLLHGFLGSHQDFAEIVDILSQHFYCILPDLPGHGGTRSHPNSYTFPKTAESLLALLRHLCISKTHLLGYSMGGRLALYLVCKFPDYFLRVMLESASPGLRTAEERKERRERDGAIAHQITTTPLPAFLTQWYRNPLFASLQNHPNAYATMYHRRKNNSFSELAQALQGLGAGQQPSLWQSLTDTAWPLLLLVGALDPKFVAISSDMITLAADNPFIEQVIVKNCGHNIHLESPIKYARIISFFLSDTA